MAALGRAGIVTWAVLTLAGLFDAFIQDPGILIWYDPARPLDYQVAQGWMVRYQDVITQLETVQQRPQPTDPTWRWGSPRNSPRSRRLITTS